MKLEKHPWIRDLVCISSIYDSISLRLKVLGKVCCLFPQQVLMENSYEYKYKSVKFMMQRKPVSVMGYTVLQTRRYCTAF